MSLKVQRFKASGTPQVGGIFGLSVYGRSVTHTWVAGNTLAAVIADLVSKVNALAVSIPTGNRPPSVVSASIESDTTIMDIDLDSTNNITGSYTPTPTTTASVVFTFTPPSPAGLTYTIQIHNLDNNTFAYVTASSSPITVTVNRGHNYDFSIRSNCTIGTSSYVLNIQRFIP
jgi:hypothetical protein